MQKLQRECIARFGHSDEASRIDSISKHCINIINSDGSKEKHVGRIWEVSTWKEKYIAFQNSDTLKHYLTNHPSFKIPSLSIFYKNSCKCIINPSHNSCVDIIKSTLYYLKRAIYKEISRNKLLSEQLTTCNCPLHLLDKSKQ